MLRIRTVFSFLLFLLLFGSYIFPSILIFLLALVGIAIFTTINGFNKPLVKEAKLPFVLLIFGGIFSYQNSLVDIGRDVYYFIAPIIYFLFGYICAYYLGVKKFTQTAIIIGVILAIYYLIGYSWGSEFESVSERREVDGRASYLVVLSLSILIITKFRYQQLFPKYLNLLFLIITLAASVVSLSRTFLLVLTILIITGLGYLKLNKFFLLKFLFLTAVIGGSITLLSIQEKQSTESFIGKLQNSFAEITIDSYDSAKEINENWRGYESYRGIKEFSKGNILNWLFGQGLGKKAPLALKIRLGEKEFEEISVFHNGYVTLLLKTGVIGLIIYLSFFLRLIKRNLYPKIVDNNDLNYSFSRNMILGISSVILITTFLISGWFNPVALISLIISLGFFTNSVKQFQFATAN